MPQSASRLQAVAQLFRLKPVLSWGVSAFALGTSLAIARTGGDVNVTHGLLALALVAFAQGFVSHGINDAVDWVTGTDKESIGKGTGGSRVIPQGKMTVLGTLGVALVGIAGVSLIGGYFVLVYGTPMVVLFAIALFAPVLYSAPPVKLGYRPFNELFVVLPALAGVVVGTDLVLAGSYSPVALWTGVLHALFCISWFTVSRVPDYEPDKRVGKVTSVVFVGRDNAALLSASYASLALPLAAVLAVTVSPVYIIAFAGWAGLMLGLSFLDPYDPERASRVRRKNMHVTTAHALTLSAALLAAGV